MPSSCSPSSQPLRGRFAQGECFAFAGLDGSARRWPLAHHVLLVSDRGLWAASRTKATWAPLAAPPRRSHPEGIEAKRRSGLLAA
jgi:hypothetical protein